jgi:predicted dehydrogenase/threonine dehydrogenase-like Zn-dependent dehydrogenase
VKQILQNLGSGETILAEVPCPRRAERSVLIKSCRSLVSLGTEKMLIDFGKGGYLAKARSQPDKVKQVLQKIKTDGLWTTVEAVKAKLDAPIPLGYCNVGRVVDASPHSKLLKGDRVVSNGSHAEMVAVPENLVAKIPESVSDDTAAYCVVSAIALQGIRLVAPTLGERVVVSGLGLIGLLAVQMLRAHGCEVLGIDFDRRKLDLARSFGASVVDLGAGEDPVRAANHWTGGAGVDAVLVTASTKSDELVHQAASMCRKRGRIVLVGVIGLNLRRADFYEKELTFQVSCSYGPGRYDPQYEQKGLDYPIGFVRWTEQRNFEAVLGLMSDGKIETEQLTTHRFDFDAALQGYEAIAEPSAMGILLNYTCDDEESLLRRTVPIASVSSEVRSRHEANDSTTPPVVAFVGAGAFTTRMLLPLLPKENLVRHSIVSAGGVSASHAARKFGFAQVSSDADSIWNDPSIDTVFITTPHHTHAEMVCRALDAGKNVFVEKPLAMNHAQLERVVDAMGQHPNGCLMVGFNRRFSPHSIRVKKTLKGLPGPKAVIATVNAGMIPAEHWTQDRGVGGGRIIGEACHFIDLLRFLVESPIVGVRATAMTGGDGALGDCVAIGLSFQDGSIGTIHYLSNGNKSFPKERIEVFAGESVSVIDNFRTTRFYGPGQALKTRRQEKGHQQGVSAFLETVVAGGKWPIGADELVEVSTATIDADDQVRAQLSN